MAQTLVVNGRPVADPLLRTAVRVAYRDVVPFGRHPVVALFLSVPAEALDVNVHPAKAEVRFAAPDSVRGLVIGSLSRALSGGAGPAVPSFAPRRPALRLVAPEARGFAEAPLPMLTPPSARSRPRPPRPSIRWRRRWRRCSTPMSSRSRPMAAWCWSTSMPRTSG